MYQDVDGYGAHLREYVYDGARSSVFIVIEALCCYTIFHIHQLMFSFEERSLSHIVDTR
jgi:hypothetical protein